MIVGSGASKRSERMRMRIVAPTDKVLDREERSVTVAADPKLLRKKKRKGGLFC